MKLYRFPIFVLAIVLSLVSCAGSKSQMPEIRPEKFSVSWSDGGGMNPVGENIYIRKDSLTYDYIFGDARNKLTVAVPQEKLDSLYAAFRKHSADKIESDDMGEVYDRGGISIHITSGDKSYQITDAGNKTIKKKWSENFNAVSGAIVHLKDELLKPMLAEVRFKIKDMSEGKIKTFNLSIDERNTYEFKDYKDYDPQKIHTVTLLQGQHMFHCNTVVNGKNVFHHAAFEVRDAGTAFEFKVDTVEIQFEYIRLAPQD